MTGDNIELFNLYAGQIFAALYKTFPMPAPINATDVAGLQIPDPFEHGESVTIPHEVRVYEATLDWLADAHFIEVDGGERQGRGILTYRGLEALKVMPQGLNGESAGDALVSSIGKRAGDATISQLTSATLTGAYHLLRVAAGS